MGGVLAATRPRQWTKNLVVFAPLIFAGLANDTAAWLAAVGAFLAFTAASAAVYLGNDVRDRVADALHPHKRMRPVASGVLSPSVALAWAVGLALLAVLGAGTLEPQLTVWVLAYLGLQAVYVLALKRVAFADVAAIAGGFVLRVAGGAAAVAVPLSLSMAGTAALLAFVLGFGKRRHDLVLAESAPAGPSAGDTAAAATTTSVATAVAPSAPLGAGIAAGYSRRSLDAALIASAALTIAAYTIWALRSGATPAMLASTPFVAAGLARYLWLVYRHGQGGAPEEILLRDIPLAVLITAWGATVTWALYAGGWGA